MKVIFLHGNGGGTIEDAWFPWLKSKLQTLGVNVVAQTFPDNEKARAKFWLPFLEKLGADENTILIGWSSGAIATMRFAETNKLLGSILVGAYYTDLGEENEKISGYFDAPWQWEKIKQNQKFIIQFASTDDPFIPIEEPRYVHKMLNTKYHEFTNQGHFGYPKEKLDFPELLEALNKQL